MMKKQGISYEVVNRKTYNGGPLQRYLDFGWICKYRISKAACIDFSLKNKTGYAVVARNERGTVVGILKFEFNGRWKKLESVGTWVRPAERKMGVARNLWRCAFKTLQCERAGVTVVSDRGKTLVESLQKAFPRVQFEVKEAGDRPLRVLKKAA
jgi:hypothetical protein